MRREKLEMVLNFYKHSIRKKRRKPNSSSQNKSLYFSVQRPEEEGRTLGSLSPLSKKRTLHPKDKPNLPPTWLLTVTRGRQPKTGKQGVPNAK